MQYSTVESNCPAHSPDTRYSQLVSQLSCGAGTGPTSTSTTNSTSIGGPGHKQGNLASYIL